MSNFDESKVNRNHGKFAPKSTSEADISDMEASIDLDAAMGDERVLTIAASEIGDDNFYEHIEVRRSPSGFTATTMRDVEFEAPGGNEQDVADFLKARYGANVDADSIQRTDQGFYASPQFTANLGPAAQTDEVVESLNEAGLADMSSDEGDQSMPTRFQDWKQGYDTALETAKAHYSQPERFDEATFRQQYMTHETKVRRAADQYEQFIEPAEAAGYTPPSQVAVGKVRSALDQINREAQDHHYPAYDIDTSDFDDIARDDPEYAHNIARGWAEGRYDAAAGMGTSDDDGDVEVPARLSGWDAEGYEVGYGSGSRLEPRY